MEKEGNFGSGPLSGKEGEHSYGGPRPQGHAQEGGRELSGFGLRNQPRGAWLASLGTEECVTLKMLKQKQGTSPRKIRCRVNKWER